MAASSSALAKGAVDEENLPKESRGKNKGRQTGDDKVRKTRKKRGAGKLEKQTPADGENRDEDMEGVCLACALGAKTLHNYKNT